MDIGSGRACGGVDEILAGVEQGETMTAAHHAAMGPKLFGLQAKNRLAGRTANESHAGDGMSGRSPSRRAQPSCRPPTRKAINGA